MDWTVLKRDNTTVQPFNVRKLKAAIQKAIESCAATIDATTVAMAVVEALSTIARPIPIERIQDVVELMLMRAGAFDVAKHYILYRQRRAEIRRGRREADPRALADYIHPAKYARHLAALQRRETYAETVARVEAMHLRRFTDHRLEAEIKGAFDLVRDQRVLPSMRSMQFAGPAIEAINARMYNCAATLLDRPRAFAEAFYLLLAGSGVGYSVQYHHVDKLPPIARRGRGVIHCTVGDDIEGWAEALHALILGGITGYYVEFSYALIRPEGSPLVTSGGLAPGHLPLRNTLEAIRQILDAAQGRRLRPIECHDIMCHTASAVLSGGVRRSAMIAIFSPSDAEMMFAKTGDWYVRAPWRANANNSVAWLRASPPARNEFLRVKEIAREWGEPGDWWTARSSYVPNPCAEIGLNPVDPDTGETGWGFCNLTEINMAQVSSAGDFDEATRAAAFIGTLQAAYTDLSYLGPVTESIVRREALLGVSMTGMLDRPQFALDGRLQEHNARLAVAVNQELAARIGISAAARVTTVKPSGTASLALGGVASGHHAHHARRYVRRVIALDSEPVFRHFRAVNPHMCVRKPNGEWVIEFPVTAPREALIKAEISAIDQLEMVRSTILHWIQPGTARPMSSPGLTHNVSNTVHVQPDEWGRVFDYLLNNCSVFTGVTLLPTSGDKDYPFAPFEAITTEADEARWAQLVGEYTAVDYTTMVETVDGTHHSAEPACAGGSCDVV